MFYDDANRRMDAHDAADTAVQVLQSLLYMAGQIPVCVGCDPCRSS